MLSVCPTTIRIPSLTKWTAGVFFTSCYMVDLCGFFTALPTAPRACVCPPQPPPPRCCLYIAAGRLCSIHRGFDLFTVQMTISLMCIQYTLSIGENDASERAQASVYIIYRYAICLYIHRMGLEKNRRKKYIRIRNDDDDDDYDRFLITIITRPISGEQ